MLFSITYPYLIDFTYHSTLQYDFQIVLMTCRSLKLFFNLYKTNLLTSVVVHVYVRLFMYFSMCFFQQSIYFVRKLLDQKCIYLYMMHSLFKYQSQCTKSTLLTCNIRDELSSHLVIDNLFVVFGLLNILVYYLQYI